MKSPAQIQQRIDHLKERENDVDVSFEIEKLKGFLEYCATHDLDIYDVQRGTKETTEIRILLWILED